MKRPESEVKLTISIATYNRCSLLRACLSSIASAGDSPSLEVLVVDNASSDGTSQMVRSEFPWVHLIQNTQNLGFGRPNNQAFMKAKGSYFLLLNSDTILQPGALEHLVHAMETTPKAGAIGPEMLNPDGTVQPSAFCRFPSLMTSLIVNSLAYLVLDRWFPRWNYPGRFIAPLDHSGKIHEEGHLIGACLMVRSHLYRDLGMLDERFFIFREETDLCKRIREAGWKIYQVPAAKILHHGASGEASWHPTQQRQRIWLQVESEWLYHCKHYGTPSGRLLVWANLVVLMVSTTLFFTLATLLLWHPAKWRYFWALGRGRLVVLQAYLRLARGAPLR